MKVAILGSEGFVGGAMARSFEEADGIEVVRIDPKLGEAGRAGYANMAGVHIAFICVPTPYDPVARDYDYFAISTALRDLRTVSYDGIVCLRSTVAPDFFTRPMPLQVTVYQPEFLTAARAYEDFQSPDIHVIGVDKDKGEISALRELYSLAGIRPKKTILCDTMHQASYMKLIHNVYRALRISFLNELYVATMRECADWDESEEGLNHKIVEMFGARDFGSTFLKVPGPDGKFGFGGACFPKDMAAFIGYLERNKLPHEILDAVQSVNSKMRLVI